MEESHSDIGHVNKTAIFENSRWRTAAILKIALSPYLGYELSNFDQILYADANFHSENELLTKNRNFANSRWRTDAILKIILWLYLCAILADYCEIWIKDEKSHAKIGHVTKSAIFKNSRWWTAAFFKNSFISISQLWLVRFWSNLVCRCKFPFQEWTSDKSRNFVNSRWRTDAILKIVFWLGAILAD